MSNENSLEAVRARFGAPPRKLGWFSKPRISFPPPRWAAGTSVQEDALLGVFGSFRELHKEGQLVWGWLIMANAELFGPGDEDAPGEMLYSLRDPDPVALQELPRLGTRLRELRKAEEPNAAWSPQELLLHEDLNEDMMYHGGVRIPESWLPHAREYRLSTVLFHRPHLQDGRLKTRLLPLVVLPRFPYPAIVLPASEWTPEMCELIASAETFERPRLAYEDHRIAREAAYADALGEFTSVFHEEAPGDLHIDVYLYGPREPFGHYLYLSGGLSDIIQPDAPDPTAERLELACYAKVRRLEIAELVRLTARYCASTGSRIANGDTLPFHSKAEELLGTSRFPVLLAVAAVRMEDKRVTETFRIDDVPVRPLTLVPITDSESDFVREEGLAKFMALLTKSETTLIFDPERPAWV